MLDNAIEAVRRLPDTTKRIISLTVRTAGENVEIESLNYCAEERTGEDGKLPQTSKEDKNRHGYGIKNMKYIAEQCGGSLSIKGGRRHLYTAHQPPESGQRA